MSINFNEIRVVGSRALVRSIKDEDENMTAGGIALPGKKPREFKNLAVVLAVGGGRRDDNGNLHEFPAKVGDMVIMRDGFGIEPLTINGEDLKIIDDTAVVGVMVNHGNSVEATASTFTVKDQDGKVITQIGM